MRIQCCFPLISFLHVPGKMSVPLWLMMGTAFHIVPPPPLSLGGTADGTSMAIHNPVASEPGAMAKVQTRHFFLTTKHTFLPWDHTKDASAMKIPVDFRKQRYVTGRIYGVSTLMPPKGVSEEKTTAVSLRDTGFSAPSSNGSSGPPHCIRAIPNVFLHVSLVAVHPHLDVALLSVPLSVTFSSITSPTNKANEEGSPFIYPVKLASQASANDASSPKPESSHRYCFGGYRAEGRLGELDTFDASLLGKLPALERASLVDELKDVAGKQIASYCKVNILNPLGAAASVDGGKCYHGMSGSPLMDCERDECIGMLYGKHTEYPQHIGYIPVQDFYPWVQKVIAHIPS